MEMSIHAKIRKQQRAIKTEQIDMILNFGKKSRKPGGAWEFRIPKRDKDKLISEFKRKIHLVERCAGKAVLTDNDEQLVVTTYPIR